MDRSDPSTAPTADAWRDRVRAELGDAAFAALSVTLPGGLDVDPLYTSAPVPPDAPPVVGATARWAHGPRYDTPGLAAANERMLDDLVGGSDGAWVVLDRAARLGHDPAADDAVGVGVGGLDVACLDDLARVFDDVHVEMIRLLVDGGGNVVPTAALVDALLARRGIAQDAASVWLVGDPFAAWARDGALPRPLARLDAEIAALTRRSIARGDDWRTIGIDATVYHDAGAHAPDELGFALAAAAHRLRTLDGAGVDLAAAADRFVFRLAVGRDTFLAIAKCRALRRAWSAMLDAVGVAARPAAIHACVSDRMASRWDPETNALRSTSAVFAALCGGADVVTAPPHDRVAGGDSARGRRIARNTATILDEESHLADVDDPAGGSYYVESLTDALARAAWETLRAVEADGGLAAALAGGAVHDRIDAAWRERCDSIDRRALAITGVTAFPDPNAEPPVAGDDARRDAIAAAVRRALDRRSADGRPNCAALEADDLAAAAACATNGASLAALSDACGTGSAATIEPLALRRDAERFEALRDVGHAAGVTAVVATLGPLAAHQPHSRAARNALAAAGVAVRIESADDAPASVERGAGVVCIAGAADAVAAAGSLVAALRDAGAAGVIATAPVDGVPIDGVLAPDVDLFALLTALLRAAGAGEDDAS